ncbi:uncharacterized protein DDB_G0287625 [Copidosoma floridanum]|uniref:uncharacterized protein DDB_G0287625 n=1 Tax=Copidosoma floridanum TaxID=29053 RepID=UPI0006C9B95A|nr:uncharacterized protein DDB_G0287625 [Copidosoma floridanum]
MAEVEAKVNMSLDDIIKMERKKRSNSQGPYNHQYNQRGGGGGGYRGRGQNNRGNNMMRNNRGTMNHYNNRNNYHNYNNNYNRNNVMNNNNNNNGNRGNYRGGGPYRRYSQNGVRGGFVQKRYNNYNNYNYVPYHQTNLRRSRSSVSLNRMSQYNGPMGYSNKSYSPRRGGGGGGENWGGGGGGRYRQSRSRSRINYQNNSNYSSPTRSYLQRTNSLPDLRDDDASSVYDRLGYQNTSAQTAYRNRVIKNALQLSPSRKSLPPQGRQRRYSAGSIRSDQILRAQRRAQYEQKLMRVNAARAKAIPIDYMSSLNEYVSKQHPSLALYQSQNSLNARQMRAKSPYAQSLKSFQTIIPKTKFVNRFAGANKVAKAAAAEARKIKVALARKEYSARNRSQQRNRSRRRSRGPELLRSNVQSQRKFWRHRANSG